MSVERYLDERRRARNEAVAPADPDTPDPLTK